MHDALKASIAQGTGVDVPALAAALGTSRNLLYRAVKRGEIRSIRIGERIVIPADAAAKLLGIETTQAAIAA